MSLKSFSGSSTRSSKRGSAGRDLTILGVVRDKSTEIFNTEWRTFVDVIFDNSRTGRDAPGVQFEKLGVHAGMCIEYKNFQHVPIVIIFGVSFQEWRSSNLWFFEFNFVASGARFLIWNWFDCKAWRVAIQCDMGVTVQYWFDNRSDWIWCHGLELGRFNVHWRHNSVHFY